MPDHAEFLQAILNNPDDDVLRLAYSDWLEEQGKVEFAEFIRVQCELAKMTDEEDPRRLDCNAREQALLRAHFKELSPLGNQLKKCTFRRGLIEQIDVAVDYFLKKTAKLFRLAPVRGLRICLEPHQFELLAASPSLARLTTLDLTFGWMGDYRQSPPFTDGLQTLLNSPHLQHLTSLSICNPAYRPIGAEGARIIVHSANLAGLRGLNLGGHDLGARGGEVLAGGPYPTQLIELDLSNNNIAGGVRFLAASRQLVHLESLNLRANMIDQDGARTLAGSAHLANLRLLRLDDNPIAADGAEALAMSSHLTRLTTLDLYGCQLRDAGIQAFLKGKNLPQLKSLTISSNDLSEVALQALANCPGLLNLQRLILYANRLGDAGVQALAASPHLSQLRSVDLSNTQLGLPGVRALADQSTRFHLTTLNLGSNFVGDEGAVALAGSANFDRLITLDLGGTKLTDLGVKALAASPHLAQLRRLELGSNHLTIKSVEAIAASPHLQRLTSLNLNNTGTSRTGKAARALEARMGEGLRF